VQRLAVRIHLPPGVTASRALRPGMSVVVDVNTKPQSPFADSASRFASGAEPHWQAAQW
jgi:multidrug resistance efflux pump